MKTLPEEIQKDINYLLSYSCDAIASYTLVGEYDPKKVAQAIDNLFGEFGFYSSREIPDEKH